MVDYVYNHLLLNDYINAGKLGLHTEVALHFDNPNFQAINEYVHGITFFVTKVGNPTGDIRGNLHHVDDDGHVYDEQVSDRYFHAIGDHIPTFTDLNILNWGQVDFTFTPDRELSQNDTLGVSFHPTFADSDNYIRIAVHHYSHQSDSYDGASTILRHSEGDTISDIGAQDITFMNFYTTSTPNEAHPSLENPLETSDLSDEYLEATVTEEASDSNALPFIHNTRPFRIWRT